MSRLLNLKSQISEASKRVRELELALVQYPDYPSIEANLKTATRVLDCLHAEFLEVSQNLGIEVCSYRVFNSSDSTKAAVAFSAIAGFQKLLSVVYGACKYGKKARAIVNDDILQQTEFSLGYSFVGSIGVTLTLPNDVDLFGDSTLEASVDITFSLMQSRTAEEIQSLAFDYGTGAINALYQWAQLNANSGLGAEILWHSLRRPHKTVFIEPRELKTLINTIDAISTKEATEARLTGRLTAANITKHTFSFQRDGFGEEISGMFTPGIIDDEHRVGLPQSYDADIRMTTTTKYSTGETRTTYELLRLYQRLPPQTET